MGAAVDHIDQWQRKQPRVGATEMNEKWQPVRRGGGARHGQRHAQHRIGAESAFAWCAIEIDHHRVDLGLLVGIHAEQRIAQLDVDALHCLPDAPPEKAAGIAVAQFGRFARASRCTRWHDGPARRAVGQRDLHLDCRIAPAVEHLVPRNLRDARHLSATSHVRPFREKNIDVEIVMA